MSKNTTSRPIKDDKIERFKQYGASTRAKKCTRCQLNIPLDGYYNKIDTRDGKNNQCIDCCREVARKNWPKYKTKSAIKDKDGWNAIDWNPGFQFV